MLKKIWGKLNGLVETKGKKSLIYTLVGFFLSSMALTVLILWTGTTSFSFQRLLYYFRSPFIVVLNYLPVAVLMLIVYLICNRLWIAFLSTGIVGILLVFTNYFKVQFRAEPFVAMDLATLAEGANAGGEFTYVFPAPFWISLICVAGGTAVLAFLAKWRIPKKVWYLRPLLILAALGFCQFMWASYYSDESRYVTFRSKDFTYFNDWKQPERAAKRGIIYSFIHSITDLIVQAPPNYDPQVVEGILDEYDSAPIPEDRRINVQIHMLESFSDLSELGIKFQKDPYENWHKLEEESYHGTLVVDMVGGGTVNSERSVMTGFSFVHPSYSTPTNSYIRYFNESGYFTQFTHPGDDWFYNRAAINERLGFQSALFEQNYFEQFPGVYHGKDQDLYPILRELYLENISREEPYFAFHLTYQNHSPYEGEVLLGEEYVSAEGLDEKSYNILNNYLSGIEATADATAAYVDMFRQDEEPVVMVFFGDHKATLGDNNSIYEALGVNVSEGTPDGCYNLYSTPYLIWINDAAREYLQTEAKGEGPVISPCYLMNEIFKICGWEGSSWLQYQTMVQQSIPVIHRKKTFWVDGTLTDQLSEEVNTLRLQRNRVEFYWRYNLSE